MVPQRRPVKLFVWCTKQRFKMYFKTMLHKNQMIRRISRDSERNAFLEFEIDA